MCVGVRVLLIFFLITVFYIANAFADPLPKRQPARDYRPLYGTSYSFEQAVWYGLSGRTEFVRLIDEYNFDWVRLPFFWDEPYDMHIADLKFAISEAQRRDIKVVIALGAKTPYYPEYHFPDEAASKVKFGEVIDSRHPIAEDILDIDRKVIRDLSGYDNIAYWQIENEPLTGNINNWKIDPSLIEAEIETVRGSDPGKRPIILNHVAAPSYDRRYKKLLDILKPGDVLGVGAYFKTQGVDLAAFNIFGAEIHIPWPKWFTWPVQSWGVLSPDYARLKKETAEKDVDLWILEMQAEPYIRVFDDASQKEFAFSADDITKANEYLRSLQIKSIGLWGAHFWRYREKNGDDSWARTIKSLTND